MQLWAAVSGLVSIKSTHTQKDSFSFSASSQFLFLLILPKLANIFPTAFLIELQGASIPKNVLINPQT